MLCTAYRLSAKNCNVQGNKSESITSWEGDWDLASSTRFIFKLFVAVNSQFIS